MKLSRFLLLTVLNYVIDSTISSAIANVRNKRSDDPFSSHSTLCSLTSEEIIGLTKSVQDSIKDLTPERIAEFTQIHGHYDCSRIPRSLLDPTSNCTQLIVNFQTSASCLVQSVITLIRNKNDTRYEELKRDVERQESAHAAAINNLKRHLKQEFQSILDLVTTPLQNEVERLLVENRKIQKQLSKATFENIVYKILAEEAESAANLFKEFAVENQLPEIVKRAYNKTSKNVEKIILFSRHLRYVSELAIAYESLFEEMKSNDHLASPDTLIFSFFVNEFMEMSNYPNAPAPTRSRVSQMYLELQESTRSIVGAWVSRIRNGDSSSVGNFAKQSHLSALLIKDNLYVIVKIAYACNLGHFEGIIDLGDNLPWYQHNAAIYKPLLEDMTRCGHVDTTEFLVLAYKVKRLMDTVLHNQSLKTLFDNLKESFPNTIKNLIWNQRCTIRNTHFNEYLTLAFNHNYHQTGILSHAFTYRKNWSNVPSNLKYFKLIPFQTVTGRVCFALQNNGYLTTDGTYNSERRHVVFTSNMNDNQGHLYCQWELTPIYGASSFTIKRRWSNGDEYLYAATDGFAFNNERRRVLTWIPGNPVWQGIWDINCS